MREATEQVLKAIRLSKTPLSKAGLVKRTHYNLATVTWHVETLLKSRLVGRTVPWRNDEAVICGKLIIIYGF
jgi:hypothetical protein